MEIDMGKVSESLWANEFRIIPLGEVCYIKKLKDTNISKNRVLIIFKHSKMNNESNDFEPNVYLDDLSGSNSFIRAWRTYRHELDEVNL